MKLCICGHPEEYHNPKCTYTYVTAYCTCQQFIAQDETALSNSVAEVK